MENIRNVGIFAHVDAGKTTVTEYMLYLSGETHAVGGVDSGTAATDFLGIERRRGISVRAAGVSFLWGDCRINLTDTPGHVDFISEVERSMQIIDGAVLVLSAVEGIEAQTEVIWNALKKAGIPTVFFVNKTDRAGADAEAVEAAITAEFGARLFHPCDPRDDLILASGDEALLDRLLSGDPPTREETDRALAGAVSSGLAFPALRGSALKGEGIDALLDAIKFYLPAPKLSEGLSAVVAGIGHDRVMGKTALVRMYGGSLSNRDGVTIPSTGELQKISQVRRRGAKRYSDIGSVSGGDIAQLCGLPGLKIGDIIGEKPPIPPVSLSEPLLRVKVVPERDGEYTPLVQALSELSDEDPKLNMQWESETRELFISILGRIQLESISALLDERFALHPSFGPPSVIYKETPSKTGEGFDSYTMPKPCWAVLRFLIEPLPRGSGLEYSSVVENNKIFYRYQHQVEQALPGALRQGNYGWEVTDLRVTLIDGGHHTIHTHPLDFVTCTPMAILDGLRNTGTTLLEPMQRVRITVREDLGGRVIRDILDMRGEFDSPVIKKGSFTLEGLLPVSTSMDYPAEIGIMSGGRGLMSASFAGYRPCPVELGATTPYRGICPLDRAKYILKIRGAIQ